MPTIESHLHTGLRGIFYFLKKVSSTIFLLCLGFLLCLLFVVAIRVEGFNKEEIRNFMFVFVVLLFGSAILWLIFRALHHSWVRRHMKQSKIDFLEQLNREGVITMETLNLAKAKLGKVNRTLQKIPKSKSSDKLSISTFII